MTNEQLEVIIKNLTTKVRGQHGHWEFEIDNTRFICLTDVTHNRMRIISPIIEADKATPDQMQQCMEANFHSALDVKYAIADGFIWSAFIHPLKELTRDQLFDAMLQVRAASLTYGDTFTSTDLVFPKSEEKKRKLYQN